MKSLEINFTITNASETVSRNCLLFGANLGITNHANITITPDFGVSYVQVLRDSSLRPFVIGEIRMQATSLDYTYRLPDTALSEQQVSHAITELAGDIYGNIKTTPVPVAPSISEYQETLQITRITQKINITANSGFRFSVLPLTTVICTVYIKERVDLPLDESGIFVSKYKSANNSLRRLMVKGTQLVK